MYGRRGGGFSRGGLYGSFVSSSASNSGGGGRGSANASSDSNRPYRGAEIAPPSTLTSSARRGAIAGSTSTFGERSFAHPTPGVSKHGYSTMTSIGAQNITHDAGEVAVIKKQRTEEDYFNDDEDEEEGKKDADLPYQPAPGSPSYQAAEGKKAEDSDSEEDPLDAFMADLEKDAKKQGKKFVKNQITKKLSKSGNE